MTRHRYSGPARIAARLALALLACLSVMAPMMPARGANSAVILIYHRFGENDLAITNIRLEQFEAHIAELTSGPYTVLGLPEIVDRLKSGEALPDRTVAITIDDAYRSVFDAGFPRLRAANLPFTLFVSTAPLDLASGGYMSWDEVRVLARAGVAIGNHTTSHLHMNGVAAAQNESEISHANQRFADELGAAPRLFAYPFGEYSKVIRDLVAVSGFDAAVAQFSGVANPGSDLYALPRFALNERYGDIDRFRLIVNALPIPVMDIMPSNPVLGPNPPAFGFTLTEDIRALGALQCFPSHMGAAARVERLGPRRIEIRFDQAFPQGRNRINCTMPGPDGRWRWLGAFFFVP